MLGAPQLAIFGMPGGYELIIFAFILLLIFGHRLPSVMRSLGRSVTEFKKGLQGIDEEIEAAGKVEHAEQKQSS